MWEGEGRMEEGDGGRVKMGGWEGEDGRVRGICTH